MSAVAELIRRMTIKTSLGKKYCISHMGLIELKIKATNIKLPANKNNEIFLCVCQKVCTL